MTKEDVIEILERFVIGAKPCSQREIVDACASAYRMLKEHPSLPSNLDEAAEDASIKKFPDEIDLDGDMDAEIWYKQHMKYWRVGFKDGFKAGAEWMQNKMFSLRFENEPLDSAARNVFKEWIPMEVLTIDGIDGGIPLYNQGALIMMFDAGAEWMAGQGVTLEGHVCKDEYATEAPFYYVETENSDDFLPLIDNLIDNKVVVQIRKK